MNGEHHCAGGRCIVYNQSEFYEYSAEKRFHDEEDYGQRGAKARRVTFAKYSKGPNGHYCDEGGIDACGGAVREFDQFR
jgi:hypothetical protein